MTLSKAPSNTVSSIKSDQSRVNCNPDLVVDAQGLLCPEPVMLLHANIRRMQSGQVMQVLATDPSTTRDIPNFCTFLKHPLLHQEVSDNIYQYFIQKR